MSYGRCFTLYDSWHSIHIGVLCFQESVCVWYVYVPYGIWPVPQSSLLVIIIIIICLLTATEWLQKPHQIHFCLLKFSSSGRKCILFALWCRHDTSHESDLTQYCNVNVVFLNFMVLLLSGLSWVCPALFLYFILLGWMFIGPFLSCQYGYFSLLAYKLCRGSWQDIFRMHKGLPAACAPLFSSEKELSWQGWSKTR